jgi:hypothetical protein
MQHPIQHYYSLVESVLTSFKIDPAAARGNQPGQWSLKLGSANVWVYVLQQKDPQGNLVQNGYFQVLAPICDVPVSNQHIFTKELLEANHSLYGVAFTIFQDKVFIKSIRELQGLEASEISSTLNRVGIYADEWDDKLKTKYHAFVGGGREN